MKIFNFYSISIKKLNKFNAHTANTLYTIKSLVLTMQSLLEPGKSISFVSWCRSEKTEELRYVQEILEKLLKEITENSTRLIHYQHYRNLFHAGYFDEYNPDISKVDELCDELYLELQRLKDFYHCIEADRNNLLIKQKELSRK